VIAIGVGVFPARSVALDANNKMKNNQSAQALTFDATGYASTADCLNAASASGTPLSACTAKE
jgi:hypothetical protein